MALTPAKEYLSRYLDRAREAVLWKVEGLPEYDLRRPLTVTGTSLLGLVEHLADVEHGYFGVTFNRPIGPPWAARFDEVAARVETGEDMFAPADRSAPEVLALYRAAIEHGQATVAALPLEAEGRVPWWPPEHNSVSLGQIMAHMIAETDRHAGHIDILRESIDGLAGDRREYQESRSDEELAANRRRIQEIAETFRP